MAHLQRPAAAPDFVNNIRIERRIGDVHLNLVNAGLGNVVHIEAPELREELVDLVHHLFGLTPVTGSGLGDVLGVRRQHLHADGHHSDIIRGLTKVLQLRNATLIKGIEGSQGFLHEGLGLCEILAQDAAKVSTSATILLVLASSASAISLCSSTMAFSLRTCSMRGGLAGRLLHFHGLTLEPLESATWAPASLILSIPETDALSSHSAPLASSQA